MTIVAQIVFVLAWAFAICALVALAAAGVLRDKDREATLHGGADNFDMYQEEENDDAC